MTSDRAKKIIRDAKTRSRLDGLHWIGHVDMSADELQEISEKRKDNTLTFANNLVILAYPQR